MSNTKKPQSTKEDIENYVDKLKKELAELKKLKIGKDFWILYQNRIKKGEAQLKSGKYKLADLYK